MQSVVVAGIMLFVAGYLVAKLLALVILANGVSILGVTAWCCLEALTLLVLRYFVEGGLWRFHVASLSGLIPSLLLHAFFYVGMLAAPFPLLRYVSTYTTTVCVRVNLGVNDQITSVTFSVLTFTF